MSWGTRSELDLDEPQTSSAPPQRPSEPESGRLVESIAALLASGEAWTGPAAPQAIATPPVQPVPAVPASAEPVLEVPEPVAAPWSAPVMPDPVVAQPAMAVASGPMLVPDEPLRQPEARPYDPLTDALLMPLETLAAEQPLPETTFDLDVDSFALSGATARTVPAQTGGRVQLGFRDGSTASLAPDSEQAAALEELAQLLNRRD